MNKLTSRIAFRGVAALITGLVAAGWLLTQAATPTPAPAAPPLKAPPAPELPDYLNPPRPPPAPVQVRPRQLPVPPATRPATNRYRLTPQNSTRALAQPFPLVFNGEVQEQEVTFGTTNVVFTFEFTNSSPEAVAIERVHTSCGCTTTSLEEMPWVIEPGGSGDFDVSMDIRGKHGEIRKLVYLYSSKGFKSLTVRADITPADPMDDAERLRNLQLAVADRQAVFRGDCATCHATPGLNKQGRALFQAVCAVCHEAEHRADMVPDLRTLQPVPQADHWRRWITHGKAETLMPAFARSEGGPLTPEQIESLVRFLDSRSAALRGKAILIPANATPSKAE